MFKAGYCKLDVTPPLGSDLSGYFYRRAADGITDPLYLIALAVSDGERTAVVMAADYIGIKMRYADRIRAAVSERTGLPAGNVMIAALHQHTAPCLADPEEKNTALRDGNFVDVFVRKCADAALMAIDDLSEASVRTAAEPTAEPIAFVRRYFSEEEGVVTNPPSRLTLTGRCAEADNTVRLVRFVREGANDIALINFSTHPDVISGTKITYDWPGHARRLVEEEIPGVSAIFFTGCQGDSNHIDFFRPKDRRLRGTNLEHSRWMGRMVADAVKRSWDRAEKRDCAGVFTQSRVIFNRTNDEDADKYDACKKFLEENADGAHKAHITDLAYATRVVALRTSPIFRPIPLFALRFGEVVIFGFGGEAFTAYGGAIRGLVPDGFAVSAVCANGYEGYFPTAEAFAQGGYEAKSSLFTPTLESEILSEAKDMISKL